MGKRGPRSAAGRAAVRFNALQHGVLAAAVVVPGVEREEDWQAHRAGILASLGPVGALEEALAERVAAALWRLRRVERFEAESIAVEIERAAEEVDEVAALLDPVEVRREAAEGRTDLGERWGKRLRGFRALERLVRRFVEREDGEAVSAEEATTVLWAIAARAGVAVEEVRFEDVPHPRTWDAYEGWTAGMVRRGVRAIVTQAGKPGAEDEALDALMAFVQGNVSTLREKLAERERAIDQKRRLRMLPDEGRMQSVARYEAHLSRQLYAALHELEAMQARRRGQAAPLARLEVHTDLPQ
jgi:hypothetical protein